MSEKGVLLEQCIAFRDSWNLMQQYGMPVKLYIREEDHVDRGDYNSIKKKSTGSSYTYNFKSFPVQFSPTEKQKEKAGIREHVSAIIYLAYKDFSDNNISFEEIDTIRSTVELKGQTYRIKDKNRVSQFYDEFLYITLGLYQV